MADYIIPRRPENDDDFRLTKSEKDTLLVRFLLGYSNAAAFALFNPHYCDNGGKLNKAGQTACRQFFSHPKNIEWLESYEATLAKAVSGNKEEVAVLDIDDTRKDKALKSLLNQAMSLVESGSDLDADSLKTISEIFKKIGLLKDEVEQVESPRRYIPVKCRAECQYRLFVESHIESGEIANECDYCRTRKFAEENGWHYDPTKNLDLPEELTKPQNTDEKQ